MGQKSIPAGIRRLISNISPTPWYLQYFASSSHRCSRLHYTTINLTRLLILCHATRSKGTFCRTGSISGSMRKQHESIQSLDMKPTGLRNLLMSFMLPPTSKWFRYYCKSMCLSMKPFHRFTKISVCVLS
jgi:hypothetical protein